MAWYDQNGAHIYYEESGSGQPVLLLPGWGGSIDEFGALREELSKRHHVIAADLPGSGKSGPQPRTYNPSYYRDDVPVLLGLLESVAAGPAHLAGFSDGGEYAFLMALARPTVVQSIVTWGSAGTLGTNVEMAAPMFSLIDDPIPPMAGFSEHLKATYGEANARVMTQSFAKAITAIISAGGDISRSRAAEITCPALLIAGEHDFLALPALVADMAQAMPNATFVEAKGASHPVHMEQPEWLTAQVAGWLARQSGVAVPAR